MCNLTLKYVKELNVKGGGKTQNMYDLVNKATLISLMNGLLHNNLTNCFTQEYFGMSGLVTSPKISLLYTPRPV